MASIFTKIIRDELPCHKVHEDELTISIMTIEPINPGHVLVIPKIEVDHFKDVPKDSYLKVMENAQRISRAISQVTGCKRVGMMVQGFEVPHFHLHLIPANSPADFSFKNAKKATPQELLEMSEKIIAAL